MVGLFLVEAALHSLGDGKESSVTGVEGTEAMLVRVFGEDIQKGKHKFFEYLHGRAEEGDGRLGVGHTPNVVPCVTSAVYFFNYTW